MYMNSTSALVNNFLKALTAGIVLDKNKFPEDLIKLISESQSSSSNPSSEAKRVLTHMSRIGLIKREKLSDGTTYIILTAKGKKRLSSVILESIVISKPNKWDGKWRVVSFDIPRALRARRYELLRELHRLGFQKLHQSMWVHPFPCSNEVKQLATSLGLQNNVIYIEATLDEEQTNHLKTQFSGILKNSI